MIISPTYTSQPAMEYKYPLVIKSGAINLIKSGKAVAFNATTLKYPKVKNQPQTKAWFLPKPLY